MHDGIAHIGEHSIAEEVTKAVVDFLEAVRIDDQECFLIDIGRQAGKMFGDTQAGGILVEEPRELIVCGLALDALLP